MDRASALRELGLDRVEPAGPASALAPVGRHVFRVSMTRPAMGTIVSVVALHSSGNQAEDAIHAAFAEMDRLIGLLSRHDDASPLAHLNSTGSLKDAPPELVGVVDRSLHYYRATGGAFDVTVKPLVDLFEKATRPPSSSERAEAAELVGARHVELAPGRIGFRRSGMGITLDGIAKGYIVDRMSEVLARRGTSRFLVNAGGDIRASGLKEDDRPWTVAVRDPTGRRPFAQVVGLRDGAIATSGNYEKDHEHIFRIVGDGPHRASVCVRADSAMVADALATSLFVMDPIPGQALARSAPRCDYFIVDAEGDSSSSPGWAKARGEVVEHD